MSKIIKLDQDSVAVISSEILEQLKGMKLFDGKISFTKTFGTSNRRATLYFTEMAYTKMLYLVREFDKEVAWHGLARRGEDPDKDEYYIYDILVYPQEVTGATVNTDQEQYQMWLMSHDDSVFNNIRMQGHSHVNMGVSPSSVDNSLYERILDQLDDDMFYIFLIWNKRQEKTVKIYDLAKNILFETADVDVRVIDDGTGLESFIRGAKDMVKNKSYAASTTQYSGSHGSYGGCGYYGSNYSVQPAKKDSEVKTSFAPATTTKKKKKKKKSGGSSTSSSGGSSSFVSLRSAYEDDEDDDNPYHYGGFGYRGDK